MTPPTEQRLITWLRNQVFIDRPSGPVVRFELRHLPVGTKKGNEVLVIDAKESSQAEDVWFEDKAGEIHSSAICDANGIGGLQVYSIVSFREHEPERISSRMVFRIRGDEDDSESEGFDSEPASQKGLLARLMRHNEALARSNTAGMGVVIKSMQQMVERLSDQNAHLQEQRLEDYTVVEELLSKRHERQLATTKAENRERLIEGAVKDLKLLLPAVVNKMSGKSVLPESKEGDLDPKFLALQKFLESLSPEQQMSIMNSLDQSQQIALMELAGTLNETPSKER